ncbi:MAG: prepilin peptidase [Anaerovoracaceae bacterium]|jgi:leader peptidase (prepilin peptidase)/N-methyltransferase
MTSAIIPTTVFILGLLTGSFLNVCICRIPLGKNFVKGRSYCPSCDALIPWYCNIPLLSYIFLKGKCKHCGNKISLIYPVVELLNALLYLAALYLYGLTLQTLFVAILFSVLIIIAFIDLKHLIIPDGLVVFIIILSIINAVYMVIAQGEPWHTFVIGFFAASVPLFILGLVYPDGMGGGDIKLMAAAGLFMGWKLILLSLFIGAIYGGIVSIFIVIGKKESMKTAIPFGPMLSLGIVTCILLGEKIISWYLSLFI